MSLSRRPPAAVNGSFPPTTDLEESFASLAVLEENLQKTDVITQKMATLLTTVFDQRLGSLEEKMKPVYNTSRNLNLISQSMAPVGGRRGLIRY
jgi:hypothetical protein